MIDVTIKVPATVPKDTEMLEELAEVLGATFPQMVRDAQAGGRPLSVVAYPGYYLAPDTGTVYPEGHPEWRDR